MRKASEWAEMYAKHVGVLSPEELEAFVGAVQLDAVKGAISVINGDLPILQRIAGQYPEELFQRDHQSERR